MKLPHLACLNGRSSPLVNPMILRLRNSVPLKLLPNFGCELRNSRQYCKSKLASTSSGVDACLLRDPQAASFSGQPLNELVQVND